MNNVNVSGPIQPTATYKTKVLKGNHSFASQVTEPNMKYVIKHDFVLDGDVTIPENCVLEFDGGSLSGEFTLTLNNTEITSQIMNIIRCNINGGVKNSVIFVDWFGVHNQADDYDMINRAFSILAGYKTLMFGNGNYNTSGGHIFNINCVGIEGRKTSKRDWGTRITLIGEGKDIFHILGTGISISGILFTQNSGNALTSALVMEPGTNTSNNLDIEIFNCEFYNFTPAVKTTGRGVTLRDCITTIGTLLNVYLNTEADGSTMNEKENKGRAIIIKNNRIHGSRSNDYTIRVYKNPNMENTYYKDLVIEENYSDNGNRPFFWSNAKINGFHFKNNTFTYASTIALTHVINANISGNSFGQSIVPDSEGAYSPIGRILNFSQDADSVFENINIIDNLVFNNKSDFVMFSGINSELIAKTICILGNTFAGSVSGGVDRGIVGTTMSLRNVIIKNNVISEDCNKRTIIRAYNKPHSIVISKVIIGGNTKLPNLLSGPIDSMVDIRITDNLIGPSTGRPTTQENGRFTGTQYFDTTINKPIYWNGSAWVDATGTPV